MANKSFSVREFDIIGETGNPKITSTEYIELNTPRVAISTDLTVGGIVRSDLTVTSHTVSSSQLNITGIATAGELHVGPIKVGSAGVITATSYKGSGVELTGIVTSLVAGNNVTISGSTGQITIDASIGGSGISDGDYGDITVSGSGSVWTIEDGIIESANIVGAAITSAKIAGAAVTTGSLADDSVTNAKIASGAVGVTELSATGTPSSSSYLRGDNTWATVSSGGVSEALAIAYSIAL